MKREIRVFRSFEEADEADRRFYAGLTPQQRLDLMLELHQSIWRAPDALPSDFKESIELLNSHEVEYVLVGAYALAYHARLRATGDLDVLVRPFRERGLAGPNGRAA